MQANVKRVHIISRFSGDGWAVKKQGASRALKVYATKEDAVLGSFPYLQLGYDLVIHRKDGSVEQLKKAQTLQAGPFEEASKPSIKNGQKTTASRQQSIKAQQKTSSSKAKTGNK